MALTLPNPSLKQASHDNQHKPISTKRILSTQFLHLTSTTSPPSSSMAKKIIYKSISRISSSVARAVPGLDDSLSTTTTALPQKQEKTQEGQEREEQEEEMEELAQEGDKVGKLSERWREIQGENHWTGLLEPMDPLLRSELIRYGEHAQACYDAFDYDPFSRYCGSCRHNRRHFFEELTLDNHCSYEVTRYLYATSNPNLRNFFRRSQWPRTWSTAANWIGYVASAGGKDGIDTGKSELGRRDIVVAWRGTVTRLEWIADLMDCLKPVGLSHGDRLVKVESGFLDLYLSKDPACRFSKYSAREQVLSEVRRLMERYKDEPELSITVTGHSLGGALALLSAYDIAESGLNLRLDGTRALITVFSFAAPRVGNRHFAKRCEELGVHVLRVVNVHDTVPKVPGFLINEHVQVPQALTDGLPWSYAHVGVELTLDHRRSPFLKETGDPSCYHNLEAHLHLLDGYHGRGQRFVLASGRDPALVNKASDFLKEHHMVPPNWRQERNKGMVKGPHGRWVQPERNRVEDHPLDIKGHLDQIKLL
ncbi:phospholipase A1-Igamma1, chloroplastic [Amborella trichopoda]|uniref:Fungal lipase-type domain-containing protein n=1 Tax=Amborella trichopoda TaxID=13333 RepID=U5CN45_AMBTC|nr:phospholipase A1-Igamma1, chloroplastic [Amborella trichopoda]ERN14561.1 hypothetical protein AMTR_s00038p00116940 [Amborella trichopoda]|eukprot:XP_006853094.1 phospholipase A1-Igamma1, chloroplastic [Amborella trichopoda]